jgi:hypothetical protein
MNLFLSSFIFIVPCVAALRLQIYWLSSMMFLLTLTSLCYHGKVGFMKLCRVIDTCYATSLSLTFTGTALYMGHRLHRSQYMYLASGCFGILAIMTYMTSKVIVGYMRIFHGMVHIFGAIGFTLFAYAHHAHHMVIN